MSNTTMPDPQGFDLYANRGPEMTGIQAMFTVIDIAAVGLRFLSRRLAGAPLWWDDWFSLFLMFTTFPYNIYGAWLPATGQGRHSAALPDHGLLFANKVFALILWYAFNLAMFKYAIILLYNRIFKFRWLNIFSMVLAVVIAVWLITVEFVYAFQCTPVKKAFDVATPGTCFSPRAMFLMQSVPTITFDLIILSLPPLLIRNVQIPAMSKFNVGFLFLLCGLVTVASIVRLYLTITVPYEDLTWNYTDLGIWSAAEPMLGLLCAQIPTYGVYWKIFRRKVFGLPQTSNRTDSGSVSHGSRNKASALRSNSSGTFPAPVFHKSELECPSNEAFADIEAQHQQNYRMDHIYLKKDISITYSGHDRNRPSSRKEAFEARNFI